MSKKSEHELIMKKSNEAYTEAANQHKNSGSAVKLDNPQTHAFRFAELVRQIDITSERSLLEIGCGNGELFRYLNAAGFRGTYSGYDINPTLLNLAKERFKGIDVHNVDILSAPPQKQFDYVVMSGLFNLNCSQSTEWVHNFIQAMFALAKDRLVFDAISTHARERVEHLYYLDPTQTFEFCVKNLSKRVTLSHHQLPGNFTICVFRNQDWRSV